MRKSGLADSPFFHLPPASASKSSVPPSPGPNGSEKGTKPASKRPTKPNISTQNGKRSSTPKKTSQSKRKKPPTHETMPPRNHDTVVSRHHATLIEAIRSMVKQFGKEAATHRFTPDEKKAIADIVYTYKTAGVRTSENEITRIAVNFLVADYKENGQNSLLDQVLKALNG